jgi:hypothetical protein
MAAPVEIEDANWHRSKQLHKECGWKHGDSAIVNLEKDAKNLRASRCAAISNYCCLTSAAFSWKLPVVRDALS